MTTSKKDKLKKLLDNLSDIDSGVQSTYKSIDEELLSIAEKMKKVASIKSVEEANDQFKKLQALFKPLLPAFDDLKNKLDERDQKLLSAIQDRLKLLNEAIEKSKEEGSASNSDTLSLVTSLQGELSSLRQVQASMPDFGKLINESENKLKALIGFVENESSTKKDLRELKDLFDLHETSMEKIRTDLLSRLSKIGGGSANQKISVNSSVMSTKYADFNFVSNTAIRWSATDDATNQRVNIVASLISGGAGGGGASLNVTEVDGAPYVSSVTTIVVSNGTLTDDGGGQVTISTGGGGSGITRTTSVLSVSSTLGASAQTDYVFFANVGVALTLPTAVGNSNLYTVKNVSGSSVLVISGQGIDDSPSALMPSNYESLSFISNGSVYGVV